MFYFTCLFHTVWYIFYPFLTYHSYSLKYNWIITLKICISGVSQLCLTLCDTMDCSLPGSSVHGIFQARVLEWVATSFSKNSVYVCTVFFFFLHLLLYFLDIWVFQIVSPASPALHAGGFFIADPPGKPNLLTAFPSN